MLKKILTAMIDSDLYIQVWEHNFKITNIQTGTELNEPPFVALYNNEAGKVVVKAVGTEAKLLVNNPNYEVVNPFSHPRQLLSSFQKAEKLMHYMVKKSMGKRIFSPSPRMVFQPMEKIEGGLTEVEIRAFRELCLGAGAREVAIYLGLPLTTKGFNFLEIKAQGI